MSRKFQWDQAGFSLVELLIAGGIMTVMALGFATMMTNSAKSQKSASLMIELTNLQSQLTATMASDVSCKAALPSNQTISTTAATALPQISFAGQTLAPNANYNGWTLKSLSLSPGVFAQDIQNGASSMKLYNASVQLSFVKTDKKLGEVPRNFSVPMRVLTQANSSKIEACTGESDLMISACTALGGVYTGPQGAATVGTCEPATPLTGSMKKLVDSAVDKAVTTAGTNICTSMGAAGYITKDQRCDYGNGGTKTFAQFVKELTSVDVDGGWGPEVWEACSCPTGSTSGTQTGIRACNNPAPLGSGAPCKGSATLGPRDCTCSTGQLYLTGTCTGTPCQLTKTSFSGTYKTGGGKGEPVTYHSCTVSAAALGSCSGVILGQAGSVVAQPTSSLTGNCTKSNGPLTKWSGGVLCTASYSDSCQTSCTAVNTPY